MLAALLLLAAAHAPSKIHIITLDYKNYCSAGLADQRARQSMLRLARKEKARMEKDGYDVRIVVENGPIRQGSIRTGGVILADMTPVYRLDAGCM
jgi:hypothetical protein